MTIGFRAITGAALALAMLAGDVATLSLTPAAASAAGRGGYHGGSGFRGGGGYRGGFRGYGYRGYRGGYGYRGYGYGGGFGVGDFLLGAAVVGGFAAIASSANRDRDDGYTTYQAYPPEPAYAAPQGAYGTYESAPPADARASTDPAEQCSRAAEQEAASNGDSGRVLSIDRVDGRPNGAQVVGTLEVRRGDRNGATERARFTCTADFGQVTAFRFG